MKLNNNWILMGIGYMIVDVNAYDLPLFNYALVQLGCVCIYVSGAFYESAKD